MTGPAALLLVSHVAFLASSVLLPPTNLTISSRNFQHILTWDDPNNEPDIYYNVDYQQQGRTMKRSRNCSNITSRQCDLTKDLTKIMFAYTAMVWSFTHHERSKVASSKRFTPAENTLLGPAQVDVISCDHCIRVSIQPPVSHLWSDKEQHNVTMLSDDAYPLLSYTIRLVNNAEVQPAIQEFSSENTSVTATIPDLLPNTNYCVTVSLIASTNLKDSLPSEPKCVTTGPTPVTVLNIIIPVVVCGVLLLCGIVLLLIGLDRAGYICMRRKFFPKALKSFPQSESRFSGINDCTLPTNFDHVEIMEQKVEVEKILENGDEYCEGAYENRKRLIDSDTSVEASSGPNPSVTSSSEASGQTTSSSGEEGVTVGVPADLASDSSGSGSSGTPLLAHAIDSSPGLRFNNSGVFNVNLNSVSIAHPADVWTDLKPGGTPEEPDTPMNSCPAATSLNGDRFICFPSGLGVVDPIGIDGEYCSSEEEVPSDNSEDCDPDEHSVSGYMRR